MRIVWWSNPPWTPTGYGKVTRELVGRLVEAGHQVAVSSTSGLSGAALTWGGVTVYPARRHQCGGDVVAGYARHFQADVMISLYDIWCMPPDLRGQLPCPWVAQIPVDGSPVSGLMTKIAATTDYPLAISLFGRYELHEAGIEAEYMPHGVDCETFSPGDKTEARKALGIRDEAFLVVMVAANKGYPARKSWPEAVDGFAEFAKDKPEAMLYVHSTRRPYGSNAGVDLDDLRDRAGLSPGQMTIVDEIELAVGIDDDQMATIYRAADVLLSPSMGEGFCLPVVEAQACGCPVVTQDCTAMSELTVNGLSIKPAGRVYLPPLGYDWYRADPSEITRALEIIYRTEPEARAIEADKGVKFARKHFDWSVVWVKHWLPFLSIVEAELW